MPIRFLAPLLLKLPILGKLPWRLIGYGVAAVAVVWFVWARINAYGDRRADAARDKVMALWAADTAERDKVAAEAIAAARATEEAARTANEVIEREYLEKLNAAAADRESVLRLLQSARGQVRASTSREATSSTIAAATREAAIAERVDRAIAGVVSEARLNADQLDALIATIKPQL